MFTSAPRYRSAEDCDYIDWLKVMRDIIEGYGYVDGETNIYTDDYSGRTDGRERQTRRGATYKNLEKCLARLNINLDTVDKMVFVDDHIENIICQTERCRKTLKRVGVKQYFYYISWSRYAYIVNRLLILLSEIDNNHDVDKDMLVALWQDEEARSIMTGNQQDTPVYLVDNNYYIYSKHLSL
jgi:hypothetical protein